MRLVTYEVEHKGGLGVISRDGKWVYPLRSLDMDYKTMQELIEGISESEKQLLEYVSGQDPYKIRGAAPIEEVKFLAPIPNPKQDVICLGINYMAHAEESARYKKEAFGGERPYAVYFSKRVNEAVANGEGIESHSDIVTDLDYEVELAVIIGKEAKNVPEEEVKNYIFGYTIINDATKATTNHTVIFQTTHARNYVHFFLTYTGSCNRHTFHNLCFNRSTHYRRNFYRFSNLRFSQFLLFCFFICFFISAFTRFTRRECQCNAQSHS